MRKKKKEKFTALLVITRCYLWLIIFLSAFPLLAQEYENDYENYEAAEYYEDQQFTDDETIMPPMEPLHRLSQSEINQIETELRTSTLGELAAWSRRLGLSESGTRGELSARIRNHFNMPEPEAQNNENSRTMTLEWADRTHSFTIEATNEEYNRLSGNVSLTIRDGEDTHTIRADEILFNRTRNILTARGRVTYIKQDSDSTETFRGEKITVNLDNWSSIFLDGSSTIDSDGTAYLFTGQVISRTEDDVTILRRATITSGGEEEALWSITASRLWLLPGSDFMIFNALLRVGQIPVFYIPFFFFPTDDLFFHPVIGHRPREGGFIQTTTYILGRPRVPPAEQSSLSRILGNSGDTELVREGMFLRSTGRSVVDTSETSLVAMMDYYVNLGFFLGVDLTVPRPRRFDAIDFSLGIGFSRTVSNISGIGYTPFSPDFDGSFDWNTSRLFSIQVPFRYRFRFSSGISGSLGMLSWNFPLNSDPFFESDFINNRSERMDWVNMIQQGAAFEADIANQHEVPHGSWEVRGSLTPAFTALSPFIQRIAITGFSSTLGFIRIIDTAFPTNSPSPSRIFFAPNNFMLYNVGLSITGNPLNLNTGRVTTPAPASVTPIDNPLSGIGIPISPWQRDETETERPAMGGTLTPPVLRQSFSSRSTAPTTFNLTYSISPSSTTHMQFMNSDWESQDDIDWSEIQSLTTNINTAANISFAINNPFFNTTVTLAGTGNWRDFTFLNEDAYLDDAGILDEDRLLRERRNMFAQTHYSSNYSFTSRLNPFHNSPVFSATNLTYSFGGVLVRSESWTVDNSPDGPNLRPVWGSWVRNEADIPGLTAHNLSASFGANIMDRNQTLSTTVRLPPFDEHISASATFNIWIFNISASSVWERMTAAHTTAFPDKNEGDWIFRPIVTRQSFRFGNNNSFTLNMNFNPESDFDITSINASMLLWGVNVNFTASESESFEFIPNDPVNPHLGGSWVGDGERVLNPIRLALSYSRSFNNINIIRNRWDFNFNFGSTLTFDLLRHTNSNLTLSYGFTTRITNLLSLTVGAASSNRVIMR
ncbi:MAG: hypothetical protein FWC97_09875, partial [Treponema sp.]|nr:hypothetical protein [Treponema sp.]